MWWCCLLLPSISFAQLRRVQITLPKMGSPFTVVAYHSDSVYALQKIGEAFKLVDSLNALYSDYDSAALAFKISDARANTWITVPAAFMDMLMQCRSAHQLSGKTFDVTIGALSRFWRQQRKRGLFPSSDSVIEVMQHVGWHLLELDEKGLRIRKRDSLLRLDFGGIAKGFAAQEVVNRLRKLGIDIVLVDAGGDIACGEAPPGRKGWSIAVNLPETEDAWKQKLVLANRSVATSGDMYQALEHGGKFYSHIISPLTSWGVTYRRNVTVIAGDGATADWLATACSILPVKKALQLAGKMQAEILIAELQEEKIITSRTRHFPDLK